MTCTELQQVLADVMEGGRSAAQEAHLQSCPACSGLVSDLNAISQQAQLLQASEEPSPRVWNSIAIALRQEGLIRQAQREPPLGSAFSRRWSPAWLLPVAAALLALVTLVSQRGSVQRQMAEQPRTAPAFEAGLRPSTALANARQDQQLLEVVESRVPSMRATYAANLQNVNTYIRDAEESAQADPNDEEAQQSLMNAYQQRAMVYEIALDRSLP
jgi:hypothetical protein